MVGLTVVAEIVDVTLRVTLKIKKTHVPAEAESNLRNFMDFVG
jgi:hypothetical protein